MSIRTNGLAALAACVLSVAAVAASDPIPESVRPEALKGRDLRLLSSGRYLQLAYRAGAVEWPRAGAAVRRADTRSTASLSPRVGENIPLGADPAELPSTLTAQAEPHVARSPVDSDRLVAIVQEGRLAGGGAVTCGYAVSQDGGRSWTRSLIPGLTIVNGGVNDWATDPVVGFDHEGVCYLNTLAGDTEDDTDASVYVHRSEDGGLTFGPPIVAVAPPVAGDFLDKNWMAVDGDADGPHPGRVLVTLTNFRRNLTNPIMSAYSDDGGQTWTEPIFPSPGDTNSQGSQPVFLPGGRLVIVYYAREDLGENYVKVVVSDDGGASYDPPRAVAPLILSADPYARDGFFLPCAVGDSVSGRLAVVYKTKFEGVRRIAFCRSPDGGETWSTPVPVNDPPTALDPDGVPAFNAAVGLAPGGEHVSVVFYDKRNDPGRAYGVDLYLTESYDGGMTWTPDLRLTDVTSDMRLAPRTSSGCMLGDYQGVAPGGDGVVAVPVWIDTRQGDPDLFGVRVAPPWTPGARFILLR